MTRILQLSSLAVLLCMGTVVVHAQKEPQVQVPPKNLSQNDGLMHTERQKIRQREAEDRAERKARKEAKEAKDAADHKEESPEDRLVEEETDKTESE